jgi:nucleotide sugar dehydrogenase
VKPPAVCVIGLGKVGLPLAACLASRGMRVIGADIDPARVAAVNEGRSPLPFEPGLEEAMREGAATGRLRATEDVTAAVREASTVIVIVPVALDEREQPDFASFDRAAGAVAAAAQDGALVLVETTVPVGVTRSRMAERLREAGKRCAVAAAPERVSSGSVLRDLRRYPKVVGGVDAASGERAERFYRDALGVDVIRLASAEAAELTKIAEGVYRDLNIALVNELARYADGVGVDITEVIAAANSQPYAHLHEPGVGVGGHCIPVYPRFLPSGEGGLALPALGRRVNDSMAAYGVARLEALLGTLRGSTVVILGVSFRANLKEPYHSPAFALRDEIARRGGRPLAHDPFFTPQELHALGFEPCEVPCPADAVAVQAWHDAYRDLDFAAFRGLRAVLDGRNALDRRRFEAAGIRYAGIGR